MTPVTKERPSFVSSGYEYSDSEPDVEVQSLGSAFDGLVIAVSGKISGETHFDIQNMVEKLGAKYEKFDIGKCTHLITAPQYADIKKVKEARDSEGCDIVDVDWLYKSQAKKKPLETKDFLVDFDQGGLEGTPSQSLDNKKRKFDADSDEPVGSWKKSKVRTKLSLDKLATLLDPNYPYDEPGLAVWIDDENEIWDATLLKHGQLTTPANPPRQLAVQKGHHDISLCRIQVIFNEKKEEYLTWLRLRPSYVGQDTRAVQLGNGSLELAKRIFQEEFLRYTGLEWENRLFKPKEDMHMFIPCQFDDEEKFAPALPTHEDPHQPSLDPKVCRVVDSIFSVFPPVKPLVPSHRLREIAHKIETDLTTYTLRVGNALLDQICKLRIDAKQKQGLGNKHQKTILQKSLLTVEQCYVALMFTSGPQRKPNDAWIKSERKYLESLRDDPSTRVPQNQMLLSTNSNLAKLNLSRFETVDPASAEYAALSEYFNKTATFFDKYNGNRKLEIISILHVERPGEAERIEKWSQDNRDKAGHRRLLWHGSPKENFFGILSQGLLCPASGLYQAEMSWMSAGYCRSVNGDGFMLLNEVELGCDFVDPDQGQPPSISYGMGTTRSTCCATFIMSGNTQLEWRDASHVHPDMKKIKIPDFRQGTMGETSHNEYVVYNAAQVRQRYLFHIKFS